MKTIPQGNDEISKVLEMFAADDATDDEHIESYFVPTQYFRRLTADKSHVVVGNYGAGKTAFIRKLVRDLARQKGGVQVIPLALRADLFGEELRAASVEKDYGTFAKALVYLHTLYRLAESAKGTLTTGDKAALIRELHALNLQPYGDLISRLAAAVGQAVGKVKKLEIANAFGLELQEARVETVNMTRYRQMCLRIEPLVRNLFTKKRTIVVIDELDAPSRLAKETAALVGVLIRWLKDEERETRQVMHFLIALPANLLEVGQDTADIYSPSQELFKDISWSSTELNQLVIDRIRTALGPSVAVEEWLRNVCALQLNELHELTFERPRNYIQLVRNCLEVKLADPNRAPAKCRELGLQQYSRQTLRWLRTEWQGANEGFKDLVDLLHQFHNVVTIQQLKDGINEIRGRGILNRWGVDTIISELIKWHLLKEETDQQRGIQYRPHPIIRLAGRFSS